MAKKVKKVKRGANTVEPAFVEHCAETGVIHNLLKRGLLVSKPYADINGVDLLVSNCDGFCAYLQVKGRQTANETRKGNKSKQPTSKMVPVEIVHYYEDDPLYFVVIYWLQEDVYLVFKWDEFQKEAQRNKNGKYIYNLAKDKLKTLKHKRKNKIVNDFDKIFDALADGNYVAQDIRNRRKRQSSHFFAKSYKNRNI